MSIVGALVVTEGIGARAGPGSIAATGTGAANAGGVFSRGGGGGLGGTGAALRIDGGDGACGELGCEGRVDRGAAAFIDDEEERGGTASDAMRSVAARFSWSALTGAPASLAASTARFNQTMAS
jgi:hypothetical protein